jgi:hypothetical protein
MIEDKILIACWKILDRMIIGNVLVIKDFAPNKPDLFIECAKQYADCFGTILFSDDYKEIKKVISFKEVAQKFVVTKE